MAALIMVEGLAIGVLGLLVAGLLKSHAEILRQLHALGADGDDGRHAPSPRLAVERHGGESASTAAADLAGMTPSGEAIAIGVTGSQHDTLLAFLSSGCITCISFWESFGDSIPISLPRGTRLVVVTRSENEESVSRVRDLSSQGMTVVMSTESWHRYGVPAAPYFVLINGTTGRIAGEGSASRWDQVQSLITQADSDRRAASIHDGPVGDGDRRDRVDAELRAAGIHAGHPSLYGGADPRRWPRDDG